MEARDAITFTAMISSHCRIGELSFAQELFDAMPEINHEALIGGYSKGGDIEKAASLFDEMSHKDLVFWTTMTSRFSKREGWKHHRVVFYFASDDPLHPDSLLYKFVHGDDASGTHPRAAFDFINLQVT
ncbi:hypothetical protein AMTR_s00030p00122720 [Amborella trichopoda]|uniref:Pentatricopeptide repeat-containing protein n=1 Tax=Amborella trichopoda TaxID=13333 RepID=U5D6U4_AMBTC|nr:hypothetical protein AMTR_s00030p00122720 [Amborella trichopoda]